LIPEDGQKGEYETSAGGVSCENDSRCVLIMELEKMQITGEDIVDG